MDMYIYGSTITTSLFSLTGMIVNKDPRMALVSGNITIYPEIKNIYIYSHPEVGRICTFQKK